MKILGLDTATLTAGLALLEDEVVLAEARHQATQRTNDLLVAIDAMVRGLGLAPSAIDAVAIGAGPGSFTGLRIGMATAKGIAFAAGRPLWAVSTLAALAYDAIAERPAPAHGVAVNDGLAVAVLDARRGEVYAGCYRIAGHALVGEERVLDPAALAAWVATLAPAAVAAGHVIYAGDALAAHPEVLAPLAAAWSPTVRTPSGVAVARLALAGARLDVLTAGSPTYIRPSEAEVKYPDGVPGALPRR